MLCLQTQLTNFNDKKRNKRGQPGAWFIDILNAVEIDECFHRVDIIKFYNIFNFNNNIMFITP